MARVLVTGISGFTGPYMARVLVERGHEVIGGVRREEDAAATDDWPTVVADLGDPEQLQEAIGRVQPERVVHLAGISFVATGDARLIYEANLVGTVNLLEALMGCRTPVERVLLASSGNVYGLAHKGELREDLTAVPANHYGVSKLACENVAHVMGSQLPITVARPFNYFGIGQDRNFVIPKLIEHARNRQSRISLGNIDVARDFSDVRMIADCYARLLEAPDAVGGTFNVCSGRSHTLRDVIALIEELAGIKFEIEVDPALLRQNEIAELFGSRARLERVIGPVRIPPLRETLEWMLES
jgi:GDP-6-deoxy-D-talose 4-dehydrogenase